VLGWAELRIENEELKILARITLNSLALRTSYSQYDSCEQRSRSLYFGVRKPCLRWTAAWLPHAKGSMGLLSILNSQF
jgi:hypothetical protein